MISAFSQLEVSAPKAVSSLRLKAVASRDELDVASTTVDLLASDSSKQAKRPARGHCLVFEVRIGDFRRRKVVPHHSLDHRGEDAQRNVATDAIFGEVIDRSKREEVLQYTKAPFDALQREVVAHDGRSRCFAFRQ